MRYWSMLLHFYQPPTQEPEITQQILNSCYLPVLRLLSQQSNFGFTLNLSGSLLLQLQQLRAVEFFNLVKKLLSDGKIELVNSPLYHPIIPLTPPDVINRQILKNQQLLFDIFKISSSNGFFPPELAIDNSSLNYINGPYVAVDATATTINTPLAKFGPKFLLINNHPVCELFRSYPQELLLPVVTDLVAKNCDNGQLLFTANDVELFGHHYVERIQILKDLLEFKDIKFITVSQAVSQFGLQAINIINVAPSTWQNCQNFSLWDKNNLQKQYLKLLEMAHLLSVNDFLDRSYSSCYLYWLSNWPWWHPGLVSKGVENIIKSTNGDPQVSLAAQKILDNMWQYHRSGQVEKNYQKFDHADNKFLGI